MAFSSVSVVASSLALRWWSRPKWMSVKVLDPANAEATDEEAVSPGFLGGITGWFGDGWRFVRGKGRKTDEEDLGSYVPLANLPDV